jgi:hypothetical protein
VRITWTRSGLVLVVLASCALVLPSCEWDGNFTVLGYTTKPNYDLRFRSVRVPVFKNRTYWTVTPVVGLDMDLTRAVIREIERQTSYKVKQCDADTELQGTIISFTKGPMNVYQMNYPRDVETALTAEIVWIDLRTGEPISRYARRPGQPRDLDPRTPILAFPDNPSGPDRRGLTLPGTPSLPSDATAGMVPLEPDPEQEEKQKRPKPILVRSVAYFQPELAGSITTAMQQNINSLATQIVSAMEQEW